MKITADILAFLEESKFKQSNSDDYPYLKKKITEQMIIHLPFIPFITLLEAGIEPVVQHKFHAEKRVKMKSGSTFSWL